MGTTPLTNLAIDVGAPAPHVVSSTAELYGEGLVVEEARVVVKQANVAGLLAALKAYELP